RLVRRSQLAAVVVGEADRELLAVLHALDRWKEEVVIREAQVGREHRVEAFDAGVEAVDEEIQLISLGRRPGLVDLDPARTERDQGFEVRPDQVPRYLEDELAARRLALT